MPEHRKDIKSTYNHIRRPSPAASLEELLAKSEDTTGRFKLTRPGLEKKGVRDVLLKQPVGNFSRLLLVDPSLTDDNVYEQLEQAGVPQLPRIEPIGTSQVPARLFGVRDGLKPLINEALFSRESSTTYISDTEIFTQLGKLYKAAWRATGQILLDSNSPDDSPLRHVAIHSFADNHNFMFLCPPYEPGDVMEVTHEEAFMRFDNSLQSELSRRNPGFGVDAAYTDHLESLVSAARQGFSEN